MGDEMPSLPNEIILDILSRIPVESLCRFKCVSKHWLASISDPDFAWMHLIRAFTDADVNFKRSRLVLSLDGKLYSLEVPAINNSDDDDVPLALDLGFDLPMSWGFNDLKVKALDGGEDEPLGGIPSSEASTLTPVKYFQILGSCHGLLCVATGAGSIYILNPSTRESEKLPLPLAESFRFGNALAMFNVCGFGYDSLNDDYRVARIGNGMEVSVYSLRASSWRKLGLLPYNCNVTETGTHLNGCIHWMVSRGIEMDFKYLVLAFDLAHETFSEIPFPVSDDPNPYFVTGVLGNCLCLLHAHHDSWRCKEFGYEEFWLMNEYGVVQSWTRIKISLSYLDMKPLCHVKDNRSLLLNSGKLVVYNGEDDAYKDLDVRGIPVGAVFNAETYVESLISPNAYYEIDG